MENPYLANRALLSVKRMDGLASPYFGSMDFDWRAYESYEFEVQAQPGSSGGTIVINLSEDGGASWNNASVYFNQHVVRASDNTDKSTGTASSGAITIPQDGTTLSTNSQFVSLALYAARSTAARQMRFGYATNGSVLVYGGQGYSVYTGSRPVSGIRFQITGGVWAAGVMTAYGLRTGRPVAG